MKYAVEVRTWSLISGDSFGKPGREEGEKVFLLTRTIGFGATEDVR